MTSYDPDSLFSKLALSKLEGVGINILTTLNTVHKELVTAGANDDEFFDMVINHWNSGKARRPLTWRSLLDMLRTELRMEDMSMQIENFLHRK